MSEALSLWDGRAGAPVFVSPLPPFHPLTLAASGQPLAVRVAALILAAFFLYLLLRQLRISRSAVVAASAALLVGLAAFATPAIALFAFGVTSSLSALQFFVAEPNRKGWALLIFALVVSLLADPFSVLVALLVALATRKAPAVAGALLAAAIAALLTAFWWMPALRLREEARSQVQHSGRARFFFADSLATADHIPAKIYRDSAGQLGWEGLRGGRIEMFSDYRLRVTSEGWNLLGSNLPWWTGWRVYWNEQRLPPVKVNGDFVGTFVPPGQGDVRFRFRPREFDAGLRVAGLGLIALLSSLLWPWFLSIRVPRVISARRAKREERGASRFPRALRFSLFALPSILLIFAGYSFVLFAKRVRVAGGADTSGYLNQARLWSQGRLFVPLELWSELRLPLENVLSFPPLGFSPGQIPGTMVPNYPPGVPLHMALLRLAGGDAAMFLFGPMAAIATLLLMYALGRVLGLSPLYSVAGASVLAVFPAFVFHALFPVSDVAATGWALATMIAAFSSDRSWRWGLAAGAALGIGVLVRPSQLVLAPAIALAVRLRWRSLLAIGLGGLPFAIFQMTFAELLYGSPFRTGYGNVDYLFDWANIPERFVYYGYRLSALLTPLMFPLGLFSLLLRGIDSFVRAALATWFFAFFAFYCFYDIYDMRFLLPVIPAVIWLAMLGARSLLTRLRPGLRWATASVLMLLVLSAGIAQVPLSDVMTTAYSQELYRESVLGAQPYLSKPAIVIGMELSGAYLYYVGETMVIWPDLNPGKFELMRAHASIGGRRWYALLSQFEIAEAMRRAPGNWVPIAKFRDVTLFELTYNP